MTEARCHIMSIIEGEVRNSHSLQQTSTHPSLWLLVERLVVLMQCGLQLGNTTVSSISLVKICAAPAVHCESDDCQCFHTIVDDGSQ